MVCGLPRELTTGDGGQIGAAPLSAEPRHNSTGGSGVLLLEHLVHRVAARAKALQQQEPARDGQVGDKVGAHVRRVVPAVSGCSRSDGRRALSLWLPACGDHAPGSRDRLMIIVLTPSWRENYATLKLFRISHE